MPRNRPARALTAVALVLAVFTLAAALGAAADAAAEPLDYRPPVDAEVVDPFRPPAHRFAGGNRGIDYAVGPGTPVVAAARGVVAFAGQVGSSLHVTVLHPDGVRTTYSFLRSVSVRRGDRVEQGQELGRSGEALHFGARIGDEYVDPRSLFAGERARARLVPDDDVRPAGASTERRLVVGLLRRIGGVAKAGAAVAARVTAAAAKAEVEGLAAGHREVAEWLAFVGELSPEAWVRTGVELATASGPAACTPPDRPPPAVGGRRLLVLVGGLGSSSASAGVEAVDARALGYAEADVHRFSYRGGTVAERPYRSSDTAGDLREAGARLERLLRRLAEEHPGVPLDVVAHSQGGLVARDALSRPGRPPNVRTLVTLGTPHQGADLAASVLQAQQRPDPGTGTVEELVRMLRLTDVPADAPALRQLVPGSPYLRDLARRPLPSGVHVTSVAARADVTVASPRSRLEGASNVVVTVDGVHDHARLPGAAAAHREIALAVAGMAPTCRARADVAVDALAAGFVLRMQRLAGPALRLGLPLRPGG